MTYPIYTTMILDIGIISTGESIIHLKPNFCFVVYLSYLCSSSCMIKVMIKYYYQLLQCTIGREIISLQQSKLIIVNVYVLMAQSSAQMGLRLVC